MNRTFLSTKALRRFFALALLLGFGVAWPASLLGTGGAQAQTEVPPDSTPEIVKVDPNRGAPGDELAVGIEGRNFSQGAYVSFSSPMVHIVCMSRVSATRLEAKLAIGRKAQPGSLSLYVSNPASTVAESAFTITGAASPATPAAPVKPAAPAAPSALPTEIHPSAPATPEVSAVDPPRVARGGDATVKLKGRNFVQGTKVSFSNPGIRVVESSATATELTARIQIASDAATGSSSLFVVNPNESEVEVPFGVISNGPAAAAEKKPSIAAPGATGESEAALRFEVYCLGEAASILQSPGKSKGTLTFAGGKLRYQEGATEMFAAAAAEIKETEPNVIFGVNTGTFHVILNSGKTYNFIAASLKPADTQSMLNSLRHALH